MLDPLNSQRFAGAAPAAVHDTLLEEGRCLGSVRTMYRLLNAHDGSPERRDQLMQPACTRPAHALSCWRRHRTRSGRETSPS